MCYGSAFVTQFHNCCINCFTIWRELFVTRRSRGRGLKRKEFLMSSRSRSTRRVIRFSSRVMRVSGVSMFECERQESVMKIFQNRPPYMSKKKASKKPLICLEGVDKFRQTRAEVWNTCYALRAKTRLHSLRCQLRYTPRASIPPALFATWQDVSALCM